jgi:glycosyltransferase involved in cell wall biosynthesis
MNIALLSPLWKKVPPEKYGGTELVVANLAKGLTKIGHKVFTFACAGSQVDGKLIEAVPDEMHNLTRGFKWDAIQSYEFMAYYKLGQMINNFDVVHNHMGIHPIALAPFCKIPFLTTLHGSTPPDFKHLADEFANENFVSISFAQRALAPNLNYVANVYHGIDTDSFIANFQAGSYLLFIGTLSHNKGIDIAVRTAKELDLPLIIAGEIRESEKDFLDKEVFPLIDGKKIKFIGEVNHEEKAKLYAGAKVLLFPSRWTEAFGLVITESLACGTPVVAMDNGSPVEIIENGKTGFVVNSENDFIEAVKSSFELSREACRAEAVSKFSMLAMAKNYVDIYRELISKK